MLWKCYIHYVSIFGKLSSGHRAGKGRFHSSPKKGNVKECSNYCTIAVISHSSKVILKILQARLQHYANWAHPDVQAGFRKGRRTRYKNCQHLLYHTKSKRIPENIYFCAEYTMWSAGLEEAQAETKIAGRNINNLRFADDTTLWQKMKSN